MATFESFGINADTNELPQDEYEVLPEGTYDVQIIQSKLGPTKDKTGVILSLTYAVIAPEQYRKRQVFDVINLRNKNSQATEIGLRNLGKLERAIGLVGRKGLDDSQLIGGVLSIRLGIEAAHDGYEARNRVKSYGHSDAAPIPTAASVSAQSSAAVPQASATMAKKPWEV